MRRLLLLGGWLVVLAAGALMALWFAGVSRVPFDWLWAYMPFLYLPVWVVLLLALLAGSRALVPVAVVVAATHVAILWPAMTGAPTTDQARDLRIVSGNVFVSNRSVGPYAEELLALDADVLVLQEVTPRVWARIEEKLGGAYPHRTTMLRDDALGSAVVSRLPLRDEVVEVVGRIPMLTVTVQVGETPVRLWNVHTKAPSSIVGHRAREAMLAAMPAVRAHVDEPLLAVGDYNATAWHPSFRRFVADAHLTDAHDAVGRGLAGTWKQLRLETLIDHVLVSEHWRVLDVREGEGVGSDHRPVIADLRLR